MAHGGPAARAGRYSASERGAPRSRSVRFPEPDPQKLPPGPNTYGNIGIFLDTEAIDKKLEMRRKKMY